MFSLKVSGTQAQRDMLNAHMCTCWATAGEETPGDRH